MDIHPATSTHINALRKPLETLLWAGETPDLNPGLQDNRQDNSQERYHWATMPPRYVQMYVQMYVQQDHPLVRDWGQGT